MRAFIAAAAMVVAMPASPQNVWDLYKEIAAQKAESVRNLREAMLNLRAARARSCAIGDEASCDQVTLSDMEIALLDMERKYQNKRGSPALLERYEKVAKAADTARSAVDDLADALEDVGR